jgi:hypothetical protein
MFTPLPQSDPVPYPLLSLLIMYLLYLLLIATIIIDLPPPFSLLKFAFFGAPSSNKPTDQPTNQTKR